MKAIDETNNHQSEAVESILTQAENLNKSEMENLIRALHESNKIERLRDDMKNMTYEEAFQKWTYAQSWNERTIFSIGKFRISMHNGWGIVIPFDVRPSFIDCDMTGEEFVEYTKLIIIMNEILENQDLYTIAEYNIAKSNIESFVEKLLKKISKRYIAANLN